MKKAKKSSLYLLVGPGLLFATLVILFYQAAASFVHPVWMVGISFSTLISLFITYSGFQELRSFEEALSTDSEEKEKKSEDLRSILDETHAIYRSKIDRLELDFVEKETELADMQEGYKKLHEEMMLEKNLMSDYQTSLEDALEELRLLRQRDFLQEQNEKSIPNDLLQKYKQLRDQFEEKSLILDQTRRQLFSMEGNFLKMKKELGMEKLEDDRVFQILLKEVVEENERLDQEIRYLEEMVSSTFPQKKKAPPKKKLEKMLEFNFETTE